MRPLHAAELHIWSALRVAVLTRGDGDGGRDVDDVLSVGRTGVDSRVLLLVRIAEERSAESCSREGQLSFSELATISRELTHGERSEGHVGRRLCEASFGISDDGATCLRGPRVNEVLGACMRETD